MNAVQPRSGKQNSFKIADREWVGTFLPYVEVFHSQATFWEYHLLLGPEMSKFNGVCEAQVGCARKKPSREQSLVCGKSNSTQCLTTGSDAQVLVSNQKRRFLFGAHWHMGSRGRICPPHLLVLQKVQLLSSVWSSVFE
jgi:hypothetical protein